MADLDAQRQRQLDDDVAGVAGAHQVLLAHLDRLADDGYDAATPSLLPGWSAGHLLSHIARNAEGLQRIVDGAARGESAEMYPGGFAQREDDIAAGADRPMQDLVDDVRRTIWSLEGSWARLSAEAWDVSGMTLTGPRAARDVPWVRWREVAVHHIDLGAGYDWPLLPPTYVRAELGRLTMIWASRKPMGLTTLPDEALAAPEWHRLAWLFGRADIDGLQPAGIYP